MLIHHPNIDDKEHIKLYIICLWGLLETKKKRKELLTRVNFKEKRDAIIVKYYTTQFLVKVIYYLAKRWKLLYIRN